MNEIEYNPFPKYMLNSFLINMSCNERHTLTVIISVHKAQSTNSYGPIIRVLDCMKIKPYGKTIKVVQMKFQQGT